MLYAAGLFMLIPVALTVCNIVWLFLPVRYDKAARAGRWIEFATIWWGIFCTIIWTHLNLGSIRWVHWSEQLVNAERHSPVALDTVPTLVTLMLVSLTGYLVLRLTNTAKRPPLLSALAIAALYIGGAECVVWIVQVLPGDPVMCALPFNLLLIYAKVIRDAVTDRQALSRDVPEHRSALIRFLARMIDSSAGWTVPALVLSLPLLGVVIALLTLFGQTPDSVIQAWTQTADWTFSHQTGPPNVYHDMHYLCTVAAGGHRRVVKPLRSGRRHGHEVLVNRQLCVANAFEQLIEERAPRFHRLVRGIYDRLGYPIARHIKTPLAADAVWVLMKPLEWIFLAVLYLCDPRPENRIAVQYPHAPPPEIEKTDESE